MKTAHYDVAVAYRIYPRVSKTPIVHRDNKYKLAELCLGSFRNSLGNLKTKMWVLLDGCPPEYEELFRKYFDDADLEFIKLDGIGNLPTFDLQLEILTKQEDAEFVYFAEDDYHYLPGEFVLMLDFLKSNDDVHFVSPFDHPDYYRLPIHRHRNFVNTYAGRHWRTANSTCLTFLTRRSTLQQTKHVFKTYTRRNYDVSIWLSLTKYRVFNPLATAHYLMKDELLFKSVVKAWLFCWKQILFGKRWRLWVPIPTIATTLESTCLAPGYDWHSLITNELLEISGITKK